MQDILLTFSLILIIIIAIVSQLKMPKFRKEANLECSRFHKEALIPSLANLISLVAQSLIQVIQIA